MNEFYDKIHMKIHRTLPLITLDFRYKKTTRIITIPISEFRWVVSEFIKHIVEKTGISNDIVVKHIMNWTEINKIEDFMKEVKEHIL